MALVRWPTDPPGKAPSHTVSWEVHQQRLSPTAAAPAAPTGPQALPVDPAYDAAESAARTTRDTTISGLQQQRAGQLIGFGYSEDPVSGALTFNPNDPFSKATLLKRNYDQSRARTGQVMGSTGGLYTGAYQQAQDVINRGQLQGEDALQKSLTSWLAQNTMNVQGAGDKYQTDLSIAAGDRLSRVGENPLYSPSAAISAASAAAAPGAAAPPPKKPLTLTAAPGLPKVKTTTKKTPKGTVKTYTRAVTRA